MDPRKFDELVAELLRNSGYDEVVLTPASKDGGRDIHAFQHTRLGRVLTFVECKRFAEKKPVGVEIVRSLRGTMDEARVGFASVVTTSRFTKGATSFAGKYPHMMNLHDFEALKKWLDKYRLAKTRTRAQAPVGDDLGNIFIALFEELPGADQEKLDWWFAHHLPKHRLLAEAVRAPWAQTLAEHEADKAADLAGWKAHDERLDRLVAEAQAMAAAAK